MRKKKRAQKSVIQEAARSLAFMDEHPEKPQVKRVNTILELLVAIRNEKRLFEKAELLNSLREAFRRYLWTREILFTNDGPHEWTTSARRCTDDDAWEYGAVHVLLLFAEYYPDHLSKIDRCSVCHKWMLRRKSDHKFCSGKCRQHDYDNDPERKEQHRANMQRLYRDEKARAERAKRGVAFAENARNKPKKSLR